MTSESAMDWAWLGDHLALDLVNTVRVVSGRREELLPTPGALESWLRAEPAVLPRPYPVTEDTRSVFIGVRDAALEVMHAAVAGVSLPERETSHINEVIRQVGMTRLLTTRARVADHEPASNTDTTAALLGHLAASLVDLIAKDDLANLAVCGAPGCGQFFHRARPNQRWCSPGCGNRARVDRHRHRRVGTA